MYSRNKSSKGAEIKILLQVKINIDPKEMITATGVVLYSSGVWR